MLYKFPCQDNSPSPALQQELSYAPAGLELPEGKTWHCQAACCTQAGTWAHLHSPARELGSAGVFKKKKSRKCLGLKPSDLIQFPSFSLPPPTSWALRDNTFHLEWKKKKTKNSLLCAILTHYEAKRWDTTFFIYADHASSGVERKSLRLVSRLQL